MSLVEIVLLSIAMGIDCMVVSFSQGLIFRSQRLKNSIVLALTMGLFQGFMPCFGYVGANSVRDILAPFSKLIVFSVFLILGMKFIFEAFSKEEKEKLCCIGLSCLLGLGVATSIDALVAGSTLVFSGNKLLFPAFSIGVFSFFMSLLGFWLGNFLKHFPSKYLEISGGLILVALAIKTLVR